MLSGIDGLNVGKSVQGPSGPKEEMSIQDIQDQLVQDLPGVDLSGMSKVDASKSADVSQKMKGGILQKVASKIGSVLSVIGSPINHLRSLSVRGVVKSMRQFVLGTPKSVDDANKTAGTIRSKVMSKLSFGTIGKVFLPGSWRTAFVGHVMDQVNNKVLQANVETNPSVLDGSQTKNDFDRMDHAQLMGKDGTALPKSKTHDAFMETDIPAFLGAHFDKGEISKFDMVGTVHRSFNQAVGESAGAAFMDEMSGLCGHSISVTQGDKTLDVQVQGEDLVYTAKSTYHLLSDAIRDSDGNMINPARTIELESEVRIPLKGFSDERGYPSVEFHITGVSGNENGPLLGRHFSSDFFHHEDVDHSKAFDRYVLGVRGKGDVLETFAHQRFDTPLNLDV